VPAAHLAAAAASHCVPHPCRFAVCRLFAGEALYAHRKPEIAMPDAFIYDHVRTPRGRGKADGALHEVTTLNLATQALAAIKHRNHLDPGLVDDVVLGCVDPVGEAGGDIARVAAICADYGNSVPGVQINRFCASGLDAVNFAAAEVMAGQHDMAIGGGVESMSRVGIGASGGAWPVDPAIALKSYFLPQGISADLIATKYGFSRDDVDAYAVESQARAATAWADGRFARSVIAVKDVNGLTILAKDEHMRPGTSMQSLAQLQPSFSPIGEMGGFDAVAVQAHPEIETVNHVHHAGNSSGIVDGAAVVLIGNEEAGRRAGLKPRARIKAFANIGTEPAIMLTGPVDVTAKVLRKAKMTLADIDLFEVNEAFASVVLRYLQAFDLDAGKVNVNGGAIALGHPLGATGAMILGTALDEIERRNVNTALVTLCIGAGMGTATIIERV
jgi:acetyl-CoA C-acetyltransferase